jgi:hypothetical protein
VVTADTVIGAVGDFIHDPPPYRHWFTARKRVCSIRAAMTWM